MGDRNNPIKFGPEWLRNLARERSAGSSAAGSQNASATSASASATSPGASGPPNNTPSSNTNSNTPSKIQLANLRYGREEMLALYDNSAEAPPELKFIDILYQPRGKPPVALNNSFEDDMRDTMRAGPPIRAMPPGERFGAGRGRGMTPTEIHARGARIPFVRQLSTGRGTTSWHLGSPRMPGYNSGGDEDSSSPLRSWTNNSNGGNATSRSGGDQSEWSQTKMYRSKRPGSNTNWRQTSREDEDWRPQDNNRSRSTQDKWERDWGDRPNQDKSQSWGSNRRTWVGGDTQSNEENLPEWAMDGPGSCGGTFDSSGAFHGYSNDDTNLPKSQESGYALTRSHTHGSLMRSKTAEEGSEEWWASEKAKKLSPKRFDASDIKFKKANSVIPDLNPGASSITSNSNTTKEDSPANKSPESPESLAAQELAEGNSASSPDDSFNKKSVRFTESKTFDALMRSDINLEEASDERGNFQSVMITPNNSLRQKHQNIVAAANNMRGQNRKPGILQMLHGGQGGGQNPDNELAKLRGPEDKIVDDIMDLTLEDRQILSKLPTDMLSSSAGTSSAMSTMVNSVSQMNAPPMQLRMSSPVHLSQGLTMIPNSNMVTPGIQAVGLQSSGLQNVGITNSALNASLGLPLGPANNAMGQSMGQGIGQGMAQSMGQSMAQSMSQSMAQSMGQVAGQGMGQGMGQSMGQSMTQNMTQNMGQNMGQNLMGIPLPSGPPPMLPGQGMGNPGMGPAGLQSGGQGIPGFPSTGIPGMSGANVNNSLFLGQSNNNSSLQSPGELQLNHASQTNVYPMHGLQHSGSQAAFNTSIYSNLMQQSQPANTPNSQNLAMDQWYYEDPKKDIQGPFSSKEMYNWYRAGFFSPSLMVRRACDVMMRPLGSYGPVVPFAQMDMMSPFPLGGAYEPRGQGPHETILNSQQGLGLDVMNMTNMSDTNSMDSMQFGTVGLIRNQSFGQQQMVESLWSQPPPHPDLMWMQQAMSARNEARVNNLPMFFWDQQPSAIASNALLPEEIAKEMKTEDQILAQLRASQGMGGPPKLPFICDPPPPPPPPGKTEDVYPSVTVTPNLEELQKLIQEDTLKDLPPPPLPEKKEDDEAQLIAEKEQQAAAEALATKVAAQNKAAAEKATKQTKENEKSNKNKENNVAKSKNNKKSKEDKRDDSESKKEEDNSKEKRSNETSPTKNKKEEKSNKKDIEKEKKEWIKEGFTIVKAEKNKDNKKKSEETKVLEEAERKRREEERLLAEEEKKKRQAEALRKQQEMQLQQQQQRQAESVAKKAPWSAAAQAQAPNKEGPTLAEIQRLEREKKLEQMKEQQQMMQIIAQQQAAALAREQEMQAGLGWAKKKNNMNMQGQSMAEIQAEARKQAASAAAAAAAAASVYEEALPQPSVNQMPWGTSHNGGGFWDSPPSQPPKPIEPPKQATVVDQSKAKKKLPPPKKEVTPAAEFDSWCTCVLTSWSAKIDVPTFVGFLKDIESPYEVKDYVKCYLGDSKDSNDFARQFLERRSKLLRVGMVTPSDDLCSPAIAVNPRTTSGSDYQEVKSKKKTKKKMMKVDANILGFSVTAAEDRINVGDIDTV